MNFSLAHFCQISKLLIPSDTRPHVSPAGYGCYLIIQLCDGSTEVQEVRLKVSVYDLLVIDINLKGRAE